MTQKVPANFMKQFEKPFYRGWDGRFGLIVLLAILVEALIVVYQSSKPIPDFTEKEIQRVQERYVSFIGLDPKLLVRNNQDDMMTGISGGEIAAADIEETDAPASGGSDAGSEGSGGGSGEAGGAPAARMESRLASAGARREAISREVSNVGLLRQLTGTGSAVQGSAVSNPFNSFGSGLGDDLDPILSSAGGLRTEGQSTLGTGGEGGAGGVRGTRSGSKAGIDDMISGLGEARSSSISRKGELSIESPSEVAGTGMKNVYRSQDAIQEVIFSHIPAIRYCYERELKRSPTLKGKVTVRITVAADGSISRVEILSSTLSNERVERCIVTRIERWKDFQPIHVEEGDVTFRQVFTFGY